MTDNNTTTMPQKTEAEKLWSEIKTKNIDLFGLPAQVIEMHCQPIAVEPSKLYLTLKSSAVLPALEAALSSHYKLEQTDRFVSVEKIKK